jgi:hypothetical protein
MKAKVIFYSQKEIKPKERTKFKKELTGHNDSSHGGRYEYRINGLLDKIQHIKPSNAALILEVNGYKKAVNLMKKYSIKYTMYDIEVPRTHFINK